MRVRTSSMDKIKYSLQWASLRISSSMVSTSATDRAGKKFKSGEARFTVVCAEENESVERMKITTAQTRTDTQFIGAI